MPTSMREGDRGRREFTPWRTGMFIDDMDDFEIISAAIKNWQQHNDELDFRLLKTGLVWTRLGQHIDRLIDDGLEPFGINLGEFDVLASLVQAPDGKLNPKGLVALSVVSTSGMTGRLDNLERAGLVKRLPDPTDRRSVQVQITAKGRTTVTEAAATNVSGIGTVVACLTPSELTSLEHLHEKMLRHLSKLDQPHDHET